MQAWDVKCQGRVLFDNSYKLAWMSSFQLFIFCGTFLIGFKYKFLISMYNAQSLP